MMKNKYFYCAILLLGGFLFSACSKDFLEVEPNSQISHIQMADISKIDPGIQAGNVVGLYTTMITQYSGGLSDSHYDFGQKSYDIFSDMQSGDMVLLGKNYGWYDEFSDRTVFVDNTANAPHYMFWRYYYRIIFAANGIINSFSNPEGTEKPKSEEARHYLGQALVMRAYSYYYLTQFLTTDYKPEQMVMPIYTTSETVNNPLSSSKDVFNLIISDLTLGIDYLSDYNRKNKSEVNATIAKGLLAYTYAYIGDQASLDKSYSLTDDIIKNGGFTPMTIKEILYTVDPETKVGSGGGFNDVSVAGWMWGTDVTTENGLDLISWWGQIDYYSYSYAWAGDRKGIDRLLYDSMRPDDLRKKQFHPSTWMPLNKFYAPGRKVGGVARVITADYVYMRVAEMYLLHAEVAAKLNKEAQAKATLKTLLADRIGDLSYMDGLSGDALKKEIWMQTRIELWGEGKSLMALKRNKQTVKFGANHMDKAGESFPYNDETMTFRIPENELLNNPSIKQ